MTIYEYLGITPSQYEFKRDYIQNPLQKNIVRKNGGLEYEKPFLEDVKFLYIDLNLSAKEMNKIMGYKIQDKLKEWCNKRDYMKTPKLSKKELYKLLYVDNVPMIDVAKMFNYKSTIPIQSWCKMYDIELKSPRYLKNKISKEQLYELYINKGMTINDIGKMYKSNKESITYLINYYCLNNSELKNKRLMNIRVNKNNFYKILYDKDLFKDYIIKNNYTSQTQLGEDNMINPSIIHKFVKQYSFEKLFNKSKSSFENELSLIYSDMEKNNKTVLKPFEIDLYNKDLKIGIEFNGNYWHGENIKNKNYHQQKSLLAEEKGIFIYHIFEYEWNIKKELIISQLNNLFKVNYRKIGARQCIIKEVNNKDKSQFLNENHLQGNDSSSIKLGLYYNNELVSLMTFCKPRFNKNYEWELSRFCCKANCNVIGGASKLFNYFLNMYKPSSIISYSNIAHTKGNLYKILGFKLKNITPPNYVWCNGHEILSRYKCQKHKLLKQGYNDSSEIEIMHKRGYYRIYDCGNKVWILNIDNNK